MNLRTRLAASFALVALGTGGAVALAAPIVVQQGFEQIQTAPSGSPSSTPTSAPAASPSPSTILPGPTLDSSSSPTPSQRPAATKTPTSTPRPTHHDDWNGPGHSSWPDWQGSTLLGGSSLAAFHASGGAAGGSQIVLAIALPGGLTNEAAPAAASPSALPSPSASAVVGVGKVTAAQIDVADVTRATTLRIVLIALVVALIASGIGFYAADRLVRPLRSLQAAATAVATGDLAQRSGLAGRTDEIGELGRSFDRMADALEVSEATRKRFLQDAVHELRTPITVIEATASAVIDGVYAPEPRHLETIRGQARLLSRIVDDLRTISLAEAGGLELRREPTEVASTLRRVAEGFRARAEASGVGIEVEAPEAVVVDADPEKLRQVLGSLVDNALRYTPANGHITLAASTTPGGIRFDVRDSGAGVATEDLPHVFERFYQADPSRDRARGSSGLGLAIVKALAEAHGGTVGVENTPPGGADFWIRLPAT